MEPHNPPLGVYLHLPFCVRKCGYCDFASFGVGRRPAGFFQPYLEAMRRELELRADLLEGRLVETVYLGGGTPTLLPAGLAAGLLRDLQRLANPAPEAEVTVEANPGTVSPAKLERLRASGYNRLSLGVQALDDGLLAILGRVHRARSAEQAIKWARRAGFANLNLDLIYAIPGQTLAGWEQTLRRAAELGPEHLSCYGLSLEEGTRLTGQVERGELAPCPEELEVEMFQLADRALEQAGYRHYEISNYARPGFECRHNLNYWRGGEYLGVGLAAHSHLGGVRWANWSEMKIYLNLLAQGAAPVEWAESLSAARRESERLILQLRLLEGAPRPGGELGERSRALEKEGLLAAENGRIRLVGSALPISNRVLSRLVIV